MKTRKRVEGNFGNGPIRRFNLENGQGDYSLIQKEANGKEGEATGRGSMIFGGFRGDKPNDVPNPIPNDDAIVNGLDQDEYNDTISRVEGIQSAVFGAGNRAYGDWNFIVGKDSKTTSRGSFVFGGKNYVGDPSNTSKYLWSMAVGGSNIIGSDYSFAAGSNNILSASYAIGLGNDNNISVFGAKSLGNGNLIQGGGRYSIAIGNNNIINAQNSIAIGNGLRINDDQIVLGNYNHPITSKFLLVLGNGVSDSSRSNALIVYTDGRVDVKEQLIIRKPLFISGGDSDTSAKIALDQRQSGQITDSGENTLLGFTDNGATDLKVGSTSYTLSLRGSGSLTYNGDNLIRKQELDAATYVKVRNNYGYSGSDTTYLGKRSNYLQFYIYPAAFGLTTFEGVDYADVIVDFGLTGDACRTWNGTTYTNYNYGIKRTLVRCFFNTSVHYISCGITAQTNDGSYNTSRYSNSFIYEKRIQVLGEYDYIQLDPEIGSQIFTETSQGGANSISLNQNTSSSNCSMAVYTLGYSKR